jgi:sugar lactone lactonase YvrE
MSCVLQCADVVGESAVWCERRQVLFWVDIVGRRLHRFHPASGAHVIKATAEMPTSIGLCDDDGAIVGFEHEVTLWDLEDRFETLAIIEADQPGNRLNEGCVAPDGSFWVGTMQNNIDVSGRPLPINARRGAIYRIDGVGSVQSLTGPEFGITNTFVWPDGQFVTADSLENALYAYGCDGGGLTWRRDFTPAYPKGLPDGSCLDSEGFIWNCRVAGGGCVVRFAPDGRVDREVPLGCSSPTSCAFGGDDLSTLFVTSSRFGMDESQLAGSHDGDLFALDVGVRGRPANRFRLARGRGGSTVTASPY